MATTTPAPLRPSAAERARTVLAAAVSGSVVWGAERVDLLGCHQDDGRGDVVLTVESDSTLARAVRAAPGRGLPVQLQLTELSAVAARERVRARLTLEGVLTRVGEPDLTTPRPAASLRLVVSRVLLAGRGQPASVIPVQQYRQAEPDPLHLAAAEHVQHLVAHHPEAIGLLTRLVEPTSLQGATRVLPVTLDRYGIVLRVESLRGDVDVRITFRHVVSCAAEASAELRYLMLEAHRHRPCARPRQSGPAPR